MHLVGDRFSLPRNILAPFTAGSNEVFFFSRWGIWDDLVKALGCEGISKSQVSRICQDLDVVVDGFLGRPLDGGPYPYLWLDALTQKVGSAPSTSNRPPMRYAPNSTG